MDMQKKYGHITVESMGRLGESDTSDILREIARDRKNITMQLEHMAEMGGISKDMAYHMRDILPGNIVMENFTDRPSYNQYWMVEESLSTGLKIAIGVGLVVTIGALVFLLVNMRKSSEATRNLPDQVNKAIDEMAKDVDDMAAAQRKADALAQDLAKAQRQKEYEEAKASMDWDAAMRMDKAFDEARAKAKRNAEYYQRLADLDTLEKHLTIMVKQYHLTRIEAFVLVRQHFISTGLINEVLTKRVSSAISFISGTLPKLVDAFAADPEQFNLMTFPTHGEENMRNFMSFDVRFDNRVLHRGMGLHGVAKPIVANEMGPADQSLKDFKAWLTAPATDADVNSFIKDHGNTEQTIINKDTVKKEGKVLARAIADFNRASSGADVATKSLKSMEDKLKALKGVDPVKQEQLNELITVLGATLKVGAVLFDFIRMDGEALRKVGALYHTLTVAEGTKVQDIVDELMKDDRIPSSLKKKLKSLNK